VQSSVKERLTGALILIVALVIVVPELFSGRPEQRPATEAPEAQSADAGPPLRSYTMDLDDTHAGQAAKTPAPAPEVRQQTPEPTPAAVASPAPVIPEPRLPAAKTPEATAPAPRAAEAGKPVEASKPPAAVPATKPAATATAAAAPAHGWWVQLGSFSARDNAQRLAATLESAGYSVRVSPTTKNGKELYRVLAGPEEDRAAAASLQARLTAAGYKGTLVSP
jgi:cell division septation protein DedD